MTNEEAIIMIKTVEGHLLFDEKWKDAFDMAISALEKQIPQKPVQNKKPRYGMGYEYYDWVCPTCGCFLAPEPHKIGNHHCKCGQAIDWSNET